MVIDQSRPKRKASGARYIAFRKKKLVHIGRKPAETKIGKDELKKIRVRGGGFKSRRTFAEFANVTDQKTNKVHKLKIESVVENPANRHFVRRNILTKNAVIKTEKGNARVTSRPGQDGVVNAVLIG